ncbi:hypothetical protein [Anabaenopsis arnoldii]|uniref:hypothetical protein n=1 Tax=Anabaenopsis arnoldii TaxID=2152938 RepID=UPI0023310F60|nr:hypothetical protein [Anabaenopsis arnoldii]MDH6091856.1 hypothetical protein [Anabaenopsis arnoldii]
MKDTENSINYLESNQRQDLVIPDNGSSWFPKHLAGTNTQGGFQPKFEAGKFVLLQYPRILNPSIPSSYWRFIPTILIALGVLGTFYGIQEGLSQIDLKNINETKLLVDASVNLLEGMKTAFSTSLMGLGCSSLFTMFLAGGEAYKRSRGHKFRQRLDKRLDQIAFVESPTRLLSRFNLDGTERGQLSPDAIGEKVGEKVGAVMSPIFKEIGKELSALREIKKEQGQEILRELITEQREQLIKPLIAELTKSAQLTQAASQAVSQLREELGGISQSLSTSVMTIQTFQKDTLVQLQEFAVSLQSILTEFRSDTQGVMERVSTEIQSAVTASVEAINSQRIAFEVSSNQAANTFRSIREDLETALHTQAEIERQMLQEFQDRTLAIITTQTESITTVGHEASQLMNGARENLISTLSNIDTMLQNTRITVQEELQQFRLSYQTALQEFFNSQNQLLEETLGEQRQGLAQVVNDLQTAFNEEYHRRSTLTAQVDESMSRIGQTVERVSNFANVTGLTSGERLAQIQEITRGLGREAHRIEQTYAAMIQQLNQALEISNQHLVDYLNKAYASENRFFTQADEATTKISNQLLQAANYLVAAEANRRHQSES